LASVNKRFQNKSTGEWESEADFFNVSAWFKLAENCAESLGKGDRVLINGRLAQDSWDDKDGQKRTNFKIIANVIAPSLEFAVCRIEKNPRMDTGINQDNQAASDGDLDFTNDDIPF